jgi:hypothetical protein
VGALDLIQLQGTGEGEGFEDLLGDPRALPRSSRV